MNFEEKYQNLIEFIIDFTIFKHGNKFKLNKICIDHLKDNFSLPECFFILKELCDSDSSTKYNPTQ